MADQDTARAYGRALLDAVSAHPGIDPALLDVATQRASAAGRPARVVVEEYGVEADLSDALGGTLILVRTLVTMLSEASGRPHQDVLDEARARFDTWWHE